MVDFLVDFESYKTQIICQILFYTCFGKFDV